MWFVYMGFVYLHMVVFHWFVSRNIKINIAVRMYLPGIW